MHHTPTASADQITRLCLIGSGIVCGLDLYVDDDYGVHITSGNGISSNGHYIEFAPSQLFRYYRPFEDKHYDFFKGLEMWELTHDTDAEPLKLQGSDEALNPFLRDKVVILYCPMEGDVKMDGTKVLLMHQSDVLKQLDISKLATRILMSGLADDDDFIYNDDYNPEDSRPRIHTLNLAQNPAHRLPELFLRRLGFHTGDPFNCPPEGVDTSVFPEICSIEDLYEAYKPPIDDATKQLDKALTQLHEQFSALFDRDKADQVQEWIELLCEKWETYKREIEQRMSDEDLLVHEQQVYVQYFYDWVRDLIQAYNELRLEIIDLMADCCPDPTAFPHHVVLGIVLRDDLARQPKPLRTIFRQPPIYNGNADRLQRMRLYCWRIFMMIKGFYLPDYVQDPELNPFADVEGIDEEDLTDYSVLKITPGRFYDDPLGAQTIPYYYPVSWSRYSVHHMWNFHRTKTCSTDQILSYHASDFDDSYTQQFHVVRPLHYSLHPYPFLRIEGHIGRRLDDYQSTDADGAPITLPGVKTELQYLTEKYNLSLCVEYIEIKPDPDKSQALCLTRDDYLDIAASTPSSQHFFTSFDDRKGLLGMEHLGGVKEGGTFIIVHQNLPTGQLDGNNEPILAQMVVADFFMPCCELKINDPATANTNIQDTASAIEALPPPPTEVVRPVPPEMIEVPGTHDDPSNPAGSVTIPNEPPVIVGAPEPPTVLELEPPRPTRVTPEALLNTIGTARIEDRDDLKRISGVGPKLEGSLNELGIFTFDQVSNMTEREYEMLDELLTSSSFKGRAKRDDWAEQAKDLKEG